MPDDNNVHEDVPLDALIRELAECGFDWRRVGHVDVHIFEHVSITLVTQTLLRMYGESRSPALGPRMIETFRVH